MLGINIVNRRYPCPIPIPTLMYHRVADVSADRDPKGLSVSPSAFQNQMQALADAEFRCISIEDACSYFRAGKPAPERTFAITFDDGFDDFRTNAWPTLERLGFPATVFIVSGKTGADSDWRGQSGRMAARLMDWKEIRALQESGAEFGGHTLTHQCLTDLDLQAARREILDCKHVLENELRREVKYFAYPFSAVAARERAIVQECEFAAAWGGPKGPPDLFNLWRVCVRKSNQESVRNLLTRSYYYRTHFVNNTWLGRNSRQLARQLRRRR